MRARLRRVNRRLRSEVSRYRTLLTVCAVALGLALGTLGFQVLHADPVPLGKGKAGVIAQAADTAMADTARAATSASERSAEPAPPASAPAQAIRGGEASYYHDGLAGRPTASGEPYDPTALTAAHRTLPLGSRLRVTNPDNGQTVVVRVTDRGPFHGNRVIDLSRAAARRLGMLQQGTASVRLALLD